MAEPSFRAPIGTHDVLPPESQRWERLVATFAELVGRAGYGFVQSPMFEDLGVFQRLGQDTEIVSKEMYEFEDKGGRRVALRPEGTAPVARAFVEHRPPVPWKVWYVTPCFRYERPQKGRYRQHHQVGVEAIGSPDPDLDVEVIALGHRYLTELGLRSFRLVINSMGTPADREGYADRLRGWLTERRDRLAADDREKIESNPVRVLDSKRPDTQAVVADAPVLLEALDAGSIAHLRRVEEGLRSLGLDYELDPHLVRGLDYYTHTLFELRTDALDAAQDTLVGGGRYDGLIEQLGGPSTPGIGFGSGIERVLLSCVAEGVLDVGDAAVDAFVVDATGGAHARDLTHQLRDAGVSTDRAWDARSMKAQFRAADRSGARIALVVGDDEAARDIVSVRDLRGEGSQEEVPRPEIVARVKELLDR